MAEGFRLRDPVHNFVNLCGDEVKLINTPMFQRLRGIRQLAMAHLVYPGALHTRFDHSLGVCHVAGLLAKQLGLSDDEVRRVRLAGLLHDLGHGPFSHVSEHALEWYGDRTRVPADQKTEKIHELVTAHYITNDTRLRDAIGRDTCNEIARLLSSGFGQPALRAIVSGPLDADKQDYLLRDSYFCGVAYGVFDVHQLHRSLVLFGPDDEKELMIDPDGVHALEQYVLAKYYLTTNVYRHRVRLITDQMIIRAIRLGIDDDNVPELRQLYAFDNSDAFFQNYWQWDDARFMRTFGDDAPDGRISRDLLLRLRDRRLLKRVFSSPLQEFSPETREILKRIGEKENAARRTELERAIAAALPAPAGQPIDARLVIVHAYTIRSVRVSSRNEEGSIMVARHPTPRKFEDESALFSSINEGYTEGYVEVYAPVAWENETEKKRIRRELDGAIRGCINAAQPTPITEAQG